MPELPEVETVVRDLRPHLIGRCLGAIRASQKQLRHAWSHRWAKRLTGRWVQSIRRRGKWILQNLLASPPPLPPPNVPPLKESSEIAKAMSVRERMEQHRANPSCSCSCIRSG